MTLNTKFSDVIQLELLGIGSAKDRSLKANLKKALTDLGLNIPINEVKDIDKLMKYDVSGIPALIVNGKVVFQKIVPEVEDIKVVLKILLSTGLNSKGFKSIVVPTDFTEVGDGAVKFAYQISKKSGKQD